MGISDSHGAVPEGLKSQILISIADNWDRIADIPINCVHTTHNINTSKLDKVTKQVKQIVSRHDRWWIDVPVKLSDSKTIWIKMLADSGADKACVNMEWANKYFKPFIIKDKHPVTIGTPNGLITPEYCLYFSFPTNNGITLKQKLLILPELPAPILADMNMLRAFGYKFNNEIPPIFKHTFEPVSYTHLTLPTTPYV